jgi:hypothetical protein
MILHFTSSSGGHTMKNSTLTTTAPAGKMFKVIFPSLPSMPQYGTDLNWIIEGYARNSGGHVSDIPSKVELVNQ